MGKIGQRDSRGRFHVTRSEASEALGAEIVPRPKLKQTVLETTASGTPPHQDPEGRVNAGVNMVLLIFKNTVLQLSDTKRLAHLKWCVTQLPSVTQRVMS